jgi:hypothetical protein
MPPRKRKRPSRYTDNSGVQIVDQLPTQDENTKDNPSVNIDYDKLAAAMLRQQAAQKQSVGRENPNAKTMNKNPTASLAPSPSVPSPSQQETDGNISCHHSITDQASKTTAVPLSSQLIGVFVDRLFAGESVANPNFVKSHPTPLSVNQGYYFWVTMYL